MAKKPTKLKVDLRIDRAVVSQINEDWGDNRSKPAIIWLSRATHKSKPIGWYGEFATDDDLSILDNEYVVGFWFDCEGIRFYGTTDNLDDTISQISGKELTYPAEGRAFIMDM